jgi:hypothetical protein
MSRPAFDAASAGRISAPFTDDDLTHNAAGRLSPAQQAAVAADIRALARQRLISIGIGVLILVGFLIFGIPYTENNFSGEQRETTRTIMLIGWGIMTSVSLLALLLYLLHALRRIAGLHRTRVLAVSGVLDKHRSENLEGFVWNRITVGKKRFLVHQGLFDAMQEGLSYTVYYLPDKSVLSFQRA